MLHSKIAYALILGLNCFVAGSIKYDSQGQIRGAAPSDLERYVPDQDGMFSCFDGKKKIPFDRVNDDYCDCEDGSDEPGTSACNNGRFYCKNVGHEPIYIDSSKINDGICDIECCDGSDEWIGLVKCPNVCAEIGKKTRLETELKRKTELEGGLAKSQLKIKAKKLYEELKLSSIEKSKPKEALNKQLAEVEKRKSELEKSEKEISERKNEAAEKEKQKLTKDNLSVAISLRRHNFARNKLINSRLQTLSKILNDLEAGHNKEFDDAAVTNAIKAFNDAIDSNFRLRIAVENNRELSNEDKSSNEELEKNNQEREEADFDACKLSIESYAISIKGAEDDLSVLSYILENLEKNYNRNFHDLAVKGAAAEFVKLTQQWNDSANSDMEQQIKADKWKATVDDVAAKLEELSKELSQKGVTPEEDAILKELTQIKDKQFSLKNEITQIDNAINSINEDLGMDLGPDNIFLAVKGNCSSIELPEYIYEVCILGSASQKVIKDGSHLNLGKFDYFAELEGHNGTVKDYNKHMYTNGAHCWNGPNRSVHLIIECGPEFVLTSVSEPEKCQYQIIMKSPTACPLVDENASNELAEDAKEPSSLPIEADQVDAKGTSSSPIEADQVDAVKDEL
ncbi:Glucosidase 2 subunit beta [Smittium mucronatum]|uniref:Glucosidase 2 subunit beta n=1 Tax=Smittium mucronatum TaxID=133383 RepID=A0A1R0H5S5_9FUNG|nr:Glucosidase 2 subunit beta [Smittium mucronatum]